MFKEDEKRYSRVSPREIAAEVGCDYVLPDYLGDVRKILFTEARCLPLPTYMSGDELSTSGAVEFRMIYTDSEGQISSFSFTGDYESCERISQETSPEIFSESEVSSFSMRLLGPRKISAKARVVTSVRLAFDETLELCGTGAELSSLERATRPVTVMNPVSGESCEREYAEAVTMLEGVTLDETRVIHEHAEHRITECRATSGEVYVSGEHIVSAIIAIGDAPAALYEKRIPFAESLLLDGACEDTSASVSVIYPSLKIELTPDDSGVSVCASLIAEYTPRALGNRSLEMTTDGYLTDRDCDCRYSELELQRFLCRRDLEDTVEIAVDTSSLSLEMPESLLFVSAEAHVREVEHTDGVLRITSDVRFSGIACEKSGEDSTAYAPLRHTAEFKKEIAIDTEDIGDISADVGLISYDARGRVEDGTVLLSARLSYGIELGDVYKCRYLSDIDTAGEPEDKQESGRITVYYPDSEDTLFSVARRFRTTTERIAIDNSLTDTVVADKSATASLHGVAMLIIK